MPRSLGRVRAVPILALLAVAFLSSLFAAPARAQVTTLAVTLLWTATGDNGYVGQAAKYELRYTALVPGRDTLAWWGTATVVNMTGHKPPPSGARDSVRITGLVKGKKYFAVLRIADAAGNWSGFSNIAVIDLTKDVTGVEPAETGAPKLAIGAPYPSPTAGPVQAPLTLARSGPLDAEVLDARGRRVRSLYRGRMERGSHTLRWDGSSEDGTRAAAGVYWIHAAAHCVHETVKLILVR